MGLPVVYRRKVGRDLAGGYPKRSGSDHHKLLIDTDKSLK